MKPRVERCKTELSRILNEVGDSALMVGFDQALVPDNIALMRALVSGASRSEITEKFRMSSASVTRLKRRILNLRRMDLRLVDEMSNVPLPVLWAPNFIKAAQFAAKHFCSSLALNGWKIRDGNGKEVALNDIRRGLS